MHNNIKNIIAEIFRITGFEVLENKSMFFSLLNDLAPMYNEERKILKKSLDTEALLLIKKILENNKSNSDNLVIYLDEELGIKKGWIDFILECFEISKTTDKVNIEVVDYIEPKYNFSSFHDMLERAKKGNVVAQYIVAYCYTAGIMVEKDTLKGAEWYKKAGLEGCVPAQYNYATLVLDKEKLFDQSDMIDAKSNLKLAVKNEHIWAMHYFAVKNIKEDRELSIHYYKKSAYPNFSCNNGILEFYKMLPKICINVSDLETRFQKSAFEYEESMLKGSKYAQYNLAKEYQSGEFLNVDLKEAFFLFKQSAESGDYRSWFELGYCYENGMGTKIDPIESEICYKKAEQLAKDNGLTFINREYFKKHLKK